MGGTRGDEPEDTVIRPLAFTVSPTDTEDTDPYSASADGLEAAMLQAQLDRLNPADRSRARSHLGVVPSGPVAMSDDPHATEKALAKMRHPSVARIWRLKSVRRNDDSDQSAG